MSVVYLTDQGASLVKRGKRLVVEKNGQEIRYFHAFKIDQVVVMGQVHLSPHTMAFLMEQGIDTVFLSFKGKYRGRLMTNLSKNIDLRRAQFRFLDNETGVLDLARRYVAGKIQNCRTLLRRQNQKQPHPDLKMAVNRLRTALSNAAKAQDLNTLRGVEGAAASAYFQGLGGVFEGTGFTFTKRTRRPPRDQVNALLSFGYTLLANTLETAVQTAGLDPYLGALHVPDYGRPSLVLDLMEEFRPIIVDSIIVAAIKRKAISPSDFYFNPEAELPPEGREVENLSREDLPVMMTHEGIKKFVTIFEKRLSERFLYPPQEASLTYRDICLAQARLAGKHFKGEAEYVAFTWR